MEHSSSPMPDNHRWVHNIDDSNSCNFSLTAAWVGFVVDQPWTAMPAERTAPATPRTLAATGAAPARPRAVEATALPPAAPPSAMTTALAKVAPTWAPLTPTKPASATCTSAESAGAAACRAPPAASRAWSHSLSNSATARVFQSSLESCKRRSPSRARSATKSPAVAAVPTAAEPIPSAMPRGAARTSVTADAMPKPALTVFPPFTAAHCVVIC
mmetsp:Transcript_52883/g.113352  ORF Transcript_52883/g.113352 Transcript_52883/m.113352 type:complete len:215 (+) Transcript_52883:584-1228(+)